MKTIGAAPTDLVMSDDQRLIRDSAQQFFRDHGGVSRLRKRRDAGDYTSPGLWSDMARLGWLGLAVPEPEGGSGLGLAELAVVLEAAGRALAPEPLIGCAVLGADMLVHAGDETQRAAWLPRLVAGEARAALAWDEKIARGDVTKSKTRAIREGESWILQGEKCDVLGAPGADVLIVNTRDPESDELDAFLVDPRLPGVTITPLTRIDSLPAANVRLDGVRVEASARLAYPYTLDGVLNRAMVALSAELLGTASAAFEMTLEYLRTREQFGVAIGTFQVLRHRAARVFIALELARSSVMAAARQIDALGNTPHDAAIVQAVSLAKAMTNDAALLVADEAVQMHGGIGMTDEHDIGLYFKRARVAAMTLGDAAFHRDRWARVADY